MNLVLATDRHRQPVLRPSRYFRALLALVPLVMGMAIGAALLRGEEPAAGPLFFFFLSLVASLYEERWIFMPDRIESRLGLTFLYRTRRLPLHQVEGFTLSSFTKGKMRGTDQKAPFFLPTYLIFALEHRSGAPLVIEITRIGKKGELEAKAARIAQICAKPLSSRL